MVGQYIAFVSDGLNAWCRLESAVELKWYHHSQEVVPGWTLARRRVPQRRQNYQSPSLPRVWPQYCYPVWHHRELADRRCHSYRHRLQRWTCRDEYVASMLPPCEAAESRAGWH